MRHIVAELRKQDGITVVRLTRAPKWRRISKCIRLFAVRSFTHEGTYSLYHDSDTVYRLHILEYYYIARVTGLIEEKHKSFLTQQINFSIKNSCLYQ